MPRTRVASALDVPVPGREKCWKRVRGGSPVGEEGIPHPGVRRIPSAGTPAPRRSDWGAERPVTPQRQVVQPWHWPSTRLYPGLGVHRDRGLNWGAQLAALREWRSGPGKPYAALSPPPV